MMNSRILNLRSMMYEHHISKVFIICLMSTIVYYIEKTTK